VSNPNLGRHRAPGRLNHASNLSAAVLRAAKPATKASAVIAVSGGMAASFALPASAATVTAEVKTSASPTLTALVGPSAAASPLVSRTFGKVGFSGVVKPRPVAQVVHQPVAQVVHQPVAQVVHQRTFDRVSRSSTRHSPSAVSTVTRKSPVAALGRSSGGVLGIAASLAGIPYVYGGTTPAGFDCSGFTQYIFGKIGIRLPRVAEAQRQAVTVVSKANARPGDLVFFGAPAHHMGIYAGNGMMWDSPHTGQVVSKRAIYSSSATFGRV
jgi:peptidoglycan DL-endopeptidase CwlO